MYVCDCSGALFYNMGPYFTWGPSSWKDVPSNFSLVVTPLLRFENWSKKSNVIYGRPLKHTMNWTS